MRSGCDCRSNYPSRSSSTQICWMHFCTDLPNTPNLVLLRLPSALTGLNMNPTFREAAPSSQRSSSTNETSGSDLISKHSQRAPTLVVVTRPGQNSCSPVNVSRLSRWCKIKIGDHGSKDHITDGVTGLLT